MPRRFKILNVRILQTAVHVFAVIALVSGSLFPLSNLTGQEFNSTDVEFFENKIRPILVEHCLQCHGSDENKIRGGLLLTSRKEMIKGGDSGPAIVLGKPKESLLISSVHYDDFEMPPKGQLGETEIAALEKWVEIGAPDPRKSSGLPAIETINIEEGRKFWSFRPREKIEPPSVLNGENGWAYSPIDRFIKKQLDEQNIRPVADTSREALLRRAYIALIGLPPTPDQIAKFVADQRETEIAFASVVDELLASPHFGERWGRHWLDVARFAESSGGGRSLMFKDAWRFRDYVIAAYNADKPFNLFVKEQIAGDLLPFNSHEQKIEQLTATGLLALGPTNYEQQDKELLRMEVIDEQVDTVGRAFMGMTLGCARCHDHKFDPIPMTDYYAIAGIFASTQSLVDGNVSSFVERKLATEKEIKADSIYRDEIAALTKKREQTKKRLEELGFETGENKSGKRRLSKSLPGIVVDNKQAELTGNWKESTHIAYFVDASYIHDDNKRKGKSQAVFSPKFESGGRYEVRISYTPGGSRAANAPVTIDHQDGKETILVNQAITPPINDLFLSLGVFRFEADNQSTVTISNENTNGHVIVDAVQFLKQPDDIADNNPAISDSDKLQNDKNTSVQNVDAAQTDSKTNSNGEGTNDESRKLQKVLASLDRELKKLKSKPPSKIAVAMSVRDEAKPRDGHVHIRGSVRNLGDVVKRGFLSVCCNDESEIKPAIGNTESGRLQLAEWIASAQHPLTARVYVNRVWRHLFGSGLVKTADNFGTVGQSPSHPELLDYLANRFVAEGWSTKKLVRQIMLSHVYQLSCDENLSAREKDPENRLLWRANRRRVDVEVLRDSILFVSGSLDLKPGGRTIRKITQYDLSYEFDTVRRSVYVPAFRNSMLDIFEAFDFANPNLVIGDRNTSTLPTQALFLMNSPMVIKESRNAAKLLLKNAEKSNQTNQELVELAYLKTLGRRASEQEIQRSLKYIESFHAKSKDQKQKAWSSFFHVLFASLDFRYVE
jgi:hypothetical protein